MHVERKSSRLSDADFEAIAERASEKAIEKIYSEIGKGMAHRAAWVIGAGALTLFLYLLKRGALY